jgi:tetratricopeptide (TPR) repeat protein
MGIEERPQALGRLDSWKEIAAYFGCDERTVKRWEGRRGLPVYRAPGGGKTTVYAFAAELEAWLRKDQTPSTGEVVIETGRAPTLLPSVGIPRVRWPRTLAVGAGVLMVCALVVAVVWMRGTSPEALSANPDANRFYRSGLYSWQTRTSVGLQQAIADFTKAIRADPKFAAAYAGLADCYSLLPEYTSTPAAEAFPAARAAAQHAIALDEKLAAAHRSLAYVDFWWSRDVAASMREFRRAIELDPRSSQTHHWYANALSVMGEFDEARREMDIAEGLDPGSTALIADKGLLMVDSGHVGEGIQLLRQVENAQPQFAPAHAYLAFAYRSQQDGPSALREMRWHGQLTNDPDALAIAAAGTVGYAAGGYGEMTRHIAAKEEDLVARGRLSPYPLAVDRYRLGEKERALALLARAVERHDPAAVAIGVELEFRGLHSDPRFVALVAKEGFPLAKRL